MRRLRIRRIHKGFFLTVLFERHGKWLVWELRRFFAPLAALAGIMAVLLYIASSGYTWSGWRLTTGYPNRVFCEFIYSGTIRQPCNTWSSLAFVPVGLWAIRRAFLDNVRSLQLSPLRQYKRYGVLFGGALVFMGLGSWLFHASLTYVGHFLDVTGMFLVGGFLFTYGFSRRFRTSATAFIVVYALIVIPLILFQWFRPEVSRIAFAGLILAALTAEIVLHHSWRNWLFVGGMVSLAFGFGIWLLDVRGLLCSPQSWFQGHSLWHILTAVSTQFSYLYYLSEAPAVNWRISYRPGICGILNQSRHMLRPGQQNVSP